MSIQSIQRQTQRGFIKPPAHVRAEAFNHPPVDITQYQREAYQGTAVAAHEFHAQRGLLGAFGGTWRRGSRRRRLQLLKETKA